MRKKDEYFYTSKNDLGEIGSSKITTTLQEMNQESIIFT